MNYKLINLYLLFFILLFVSCKKENSEIKQTKKINVVAKKPQIEKNKFTKSGYFTRLKPERQKLAFGKWKLKSLIYQNYEDKIIRKIPISIFVTVNENGIYDSNNNLIAETFESKIGTYKFLNLDSLNSTTFNVFTIEENKRMMMKTGTIRRVVNNKLTKESVCAELYFEK